MNSKFIIFSLVCINAYDSYGQDTTITLTNKKHILQEVSINFQANRLTPISFQDINLDQIQAKTYGQEPSAILSETPSITAFSDNGNSQGYSYIRLRGIDQSRINLTLDGVPINEPEDQGAYFSNYPDIFNSVSKIQIQRGVGTSKNGVASYGGSIELFTPNLFNPKHLEVGLTYGSYNTARAYATYNSGIKNNKGIFIRASQTYTDGYKHDAGNKGHSVFLSTGLFKTKDILKVNVLAGQQKNELSWLGVSEAAIKNDKRSNANDNEQDKITQILAQLQHTHLFNSNSKLQTSLYYTFATGEYDFNFNNFLGSPEPNTNMFAYGFHSNLIGLYSNYTFDKNNFKWTTGIHANRYVKDHVGLQEIEGEIYRNTGKKMEASAFSKLEYEYKQFNFFVDMQVRTAHFVYEGNVKMPDLSWTFINPKAGLSYLTKKDYLIYYSIGKSNREPTRTDIFIGNDDLLADSLGNPILGNTKAESVIDQELGLRKSFNKGFININGYFMNFKNEIVLNGNFGPNALPLTSNVAQSYRSGIELSTSYKINKHIRISNNSSFNHSKIKESDITFVPILTPKWILNQEVSYTLNDWKFALNGRYQSSSYLNFSNNEKINSYFLANAKIYYVRPKYEVGLHFNNITNANYYNQGYVEADGTRKLFVQAPINALLTFKYIIL